MTLNTGGRLSPDEIPLPSSGTRFKVQRQALARRVVFATLLAAALAALAIGTMQKQWSRIHTFSTEI